jgi:hypothetical protein
MKIYILLSGRFGEKVIGNLVNLSSFCKVCGATCIFCRSEQPSFGSRIAGVYIVPNDVPSILDYPEDYLPKNPPQADIILPIGIHLDILTAMPKLAKITGAKGVIVPIEDVGWCPQKLSQRLKKELDEIGVESAFPKPFCTLEESGSPVIDKFVKELGVGRPQLAAKICDGVISEVKVIRSTPCGSTWFTAHEIKGLKVDDTLDKVVWKSHRGYPCTASTHIDPETEQPFLNLSGQIILDAIHDALSMEHETTPLIKRRDI